MTACSQTHPSIFDFTYAGVKYVGIRADDWETMVAKRLGSNELNRDRLHTVHLLRHDVRDEERKKDSYMRDVDDAKERERIALQRMGEAIDENAKLQAKVKRLRPWATFGKVTVAVGVVGITIAGIETFKESIK